MSVQEGAPDSKSQDPAKNFRENDVPEWKKDTRMGIVPRGSIREQKESLPIFQVKKQFLAAVHDNQVLVVIGETGSGKTTQVSSRQKCFSKFEVVFYRVKVSFHLCLRRSRITKAPLNWRKFF